jgi:hypothetical protein
MCRDMVMVDFMTLPENRTFYYPQNHHLLEETGSIRRDRPFVSFSDRLDSYL